MIRSVNLVGSISRDAGGLFESVRGLVKSLQDLGVGIHVLASEDRWSAEDIRLWSPVAVQTLPPRWLKGFGYSPRLLQAIEELRPDVVHSHGIWQYHGIASRRYSRRHGTPYIISPQGMVDPWALRNSRAKKVLASLIYESSNMQNAAVMRALAESEAQAFRTHGLRNAIAVIPNGIDLPEEGVAAEGPSWLRYVERGRKILLFLGRLHPKKGLPSLLSAWRAAQRTTASRDWVLVIAGWEQGGHENELKRMATEEGTLWADVRHQTTEPKSRAAVSASVLFVGPQFGGEKAATLRCTSAFILPSFSEGMPVAVLEAWSYGVPVMMTAECNLPEGFVGDAAICIEPSAESISIGLQELFNASDAVLRTMGERGRALVASRFTWRKIAFEMEAVYEWLLGGGTKPACVIP